MNVLELLMTVQVISIIVDTATIQVPKRKKREMQYATPPIPVFLSSAIASGMSNCPPSLNRSLTPLSTRQMLRTFDQKGGRYLPSYMAADEASATHFPNLLSFSDSNEDGISLNFDPVVDNAITKTKLLEDLNTWSRKHSLQTFNHSTLPTASATVTDGLKDNYNVVQSTFESVSSQFEYLFKNKEMTSSALRDFMKASNISVNPRILMQLQLGSAMGNKRTTRSVDGATTTVDFCNQKGTETDSGFLRMCTACAVTTQLTKDKFPRYINEVICMEQDKTCLTVQGTPHGACKQGYIHLNLLRRRPGGCMMMKKDGQKSIVGEWETYTQRIRSGCECYIDKRSLFAKYIGPFGK